MLHIVQVVLPGTVEKPQVFVEKSHAEAAFVAATQKYWKQAYAAYCENEDGDGDSYASAQAFVASFDLADRSRIQLWSLSPEDAGSEFGAGVPDVRQERLSQLVAEMEQALEPFRCGMAELRELVGDSHSVKPREEVPPLPPVNERSQPRRLAAADSLPAAKTPATPETSRDRYDSKAREAYIGSIMHMSGGNRNEFKLFQRSDWRQAVYSDETALEYWEWVVSQIDTHIEQAQEAGYTVYEDPEQPGCYRFKSPTGEVSDVAVKAEGETWCRAGLHLAGRR